MPATSTALAQPTPRRAGVRRLLGAHELGVFIPIIGLTIIFALSNPGFFTPITFASIVRACSYVGIVAVGETLLMLAGELDLSVGSVAGLGATVAALFMTSWHLPVPMAIILGVSVGGLVGLVNGLVTVKAGIPAVIATLAMLFIARGLNFVLSQGNPIYPLPEEFVRVGGEDAFGVSWAFVVFVALVIVADIAMRFTIIGSRIAATGGNARAARRAGINTDRVKIACFVLIGALAAVAGVLLAGRSGTADPQIGNGTEFDVITAVVIGGVSLFGGVGTVLGTLLGALILQEMRTGLVFMGVDINWTGVAIGVSLIVAVGTDVVRRRASSGRLSTA